MIVITDAHVSHANGNTDAFFEMLDVLRNWPEEIVFLGDIFDLWISLPRYEENIQKRFLAWCEQRRALGVGFIEGNHEFYVTRRNGACFSWHSESGHQKGDVLMVHGDLINREDRNYLWWRRLSKNAVMRTFVRFLPGGPKLVHDVKAKMKKTNQAYRIHLPKEALESYGRQCFQRGIKQVLVGHFHERFLFEGENGERLDVLPDWFATQEITNLKASGELEIGHWQQVLKQA